MKKLFTLLCLALLITPSFAQDEEKELKRPDNIGDTETDAFVNQSFDLYASTLKTDKDLKAIEADIEKIEKDGNKIKQDADVLKRLYAIQGEIRSRDEKAKELDNKAADMAKHAKDIKPIKLVPQATKNVKSATKALDKTKEMTPNQVKKTEELLGRANKMVEK